MNGGSRDARVLRPGGVPAERRRARPRPGLLLTATAARQVGAELLGTGLLATVVVGSGIAAQRLSPADPGLQLLESSFATALGLAVLIAILQPVSGAHLNPVVTLADRFLGATRRAGATLCYLAAQLVGAAAGAVLANAMFGVATSISARDRLDAAHLLGEVVATAGLVLVVVALMRTGRTALLGPAVGAYIGAAYWFTSSTAFANPAVTLGRVLTDTAAGIAPISALSFIAAQVVGGALGVILARALYPRPKEIPMSATTPSVMFACVHNAGRSQMALGFFRRLAGDRAVARSGGSDPGERLNPVAVAAMAEVGIDISAEAPAAWTPVALQASDVIVTMGCGDECPFYPGRRYLDWELDDPAGQSIERVREIRDEIERRVRGLIEELGVGA